MKMEPEIRQLLILQDRDQKWSKLIAELEFVPRERKALEAKAEELLGEIDNAQSQLRELELERQQIDGEIEAAEEKIRRFKQQQMEVKKNDEYSALTKEIERSQSAIDSLEDRGLVTLAAIDEARTAFGAQKGLIEDRRSKVRGQIDQLKERETETANRVQAAEADFNAAREGISADWLAAYDRVRKTTRNFPYVAAIVDGKCTGCHLRVSGETIEGLKEQGAPVFCDQCGRIVYYPES
jgi:predicted  nucleic acid-binding Zn-ribbon protein